MNGSGILEEMHLDARRQAETMAIDSSPLVPPHFPFERSFRKAGDFSRTARLVNRPRAGIYQSREERKRDSRPQEKKKKKKKRRQSAGRDGRNDALKQ